MSTMSISVPIVKTKSQVSIDEFGSDLTSGSTEELLMYEVSWSPLTLGINDCPSNYANCPVGDFYEYTSIQFELQIFGEGGLQCTEAPTMPGAPTLTDPGDTLWHPEGSREIGGISLFNPNTASVYNGTTTSRFLAVAATGLTNALIPTILLGRFYLQIAPGNEGKSITVVVSDNRTTLSVVKTQFNYTELSGALIYNYYTIPAAATYVKNPSLGTLASATQYEGVSGDSDGNNTTGNLYLLDDSTGKLYNSDLAGTDVAAQHYNCAYTCGYVNQYTYTLGSEVTGTDRPANLYGLNVTSLIWTLT